MPVITGGTIHSGITAARVFKGAGAPTVNVTLLGNAGIGDLYSDTTNGKLYICTATNGTSTITWTVVGTQT
jgi:hypothetical protein